MSDALRDLRSELRARLDIVVESFAEAVSRHAKKKEDIETEYTTTVAELERERTALEQLLTIEEKRYGGQQVKTDDGKTAKLIAPEALDKGFAA
jgi:hypothetical protein